MLRNSFCHIPGVGPRVENRFWSLGYLSWQSVLQRYTPQISERVFSSVARHVEESLFELKNENAAFFSARMPTDQHWRLFPEFRHSVAYLDIESTGLSAGYNTITTIALYDGTDIRCYVKGRNLDTFKNEISKYKLIVTYNGKCFDVPFIEQFFGIQVEAAHIDLRYVLKSLGYAGGLKSCEKQMGIDRGDLDGVDGYFAVLLWQDFQENRNELALETLLAYNVEDVVNLESLMVQAYNLKVRPTPFSDSHRHDLPLSPEIPFRPDPETIRRVRDTYLYR